jgi:DNA-binding SARP family transcriptional activator
VRAADNLATAKALAEQAIQESAAHEPWRATALLARGWVALLAGDLEQARADAAAARTLAGRRRDQACLADAFQLAASSAADVRTSAALIGEAVTLWRVIGDAVSEAAAVLAAARLCGSGGVARAAEVLGEHGVPLDTGMADVLGVGVLREARLTVRTLGGFQVLRDGIPVPNTEWQSRKARDLLKILVAARGRPVPRSRLVELLWPHDVSARTGNRLSVLLSTVRAVLTPGGQPVDDEPVTADRDSASIDVLVVDVDVARFLAAAADARVAQRRGDRRAVDLLMEAEELYQGEFLPEDPDEEWAIAVREETRSTYAVVLRTLVQLVADPDQKVGYLMRLLEQDHYDEGAHLQLVDILRATGRYGEAKRRRRTYLERMREIGVAPRAELPAPARR